MKPFDKVYLVDYRGQSDTAGNPLGHGLKTLIEASLLLQPVYPVALVFPRTWQPALAEGLAGTTENILLPFYSPVSWFGWWGKISGLIKKMINLVTLFRRVGEGTLWFVNCDAGLFLFLFFHPFSGRRKIFATLYLDGLEDRPGLCSRFKAYLIRRAGKKLDLVFKNSRRLSAVEREVFYPDYLFRPEKYCPFQAPVRQGLVCPGVMNGAKDLPTLVNVCREAGLEIRIVGYFPDKKYYAQVQVLAGPGIAVEDRVLPEDGYYSLIGSSRFCLLPYRQGSYSRRTSGILLESIFLDTPVVAPQFLLDYTGLPGIGFERLEDLPAVLQNLDERRWRQIKEQMATVRQDYRLETVRIRILAALKAGLDRGQHG